MRNILSPINEFEYVDDNEQKVDQSNSIKSVTEQKSSDRILDENERSIIINESQPLARCSVLYLGTAIPSTDQRGIESIQEPLAKRYPVDGTEVVQGIEAWLSIDENGLQIQFVSDPSVLIYYPIRSLVYCASIRFATRTQTGDKFPNGWRFVPLDSPDAMLTENTQNPPLFAVTFHRTRHLPIDECHCFVAKTKQVALSLVEACCNAYQATNADQDCSKVPLYFKINEDGSGMKEIDDEISIVPALDDEQRLDYQINNEAVGFFYKTDQVPIDSWQLWEHPKQGIRRSSSQHSSSSPSSPSSHRYTRQRRLASITSIPDTHKPPEPQTTNDFTDQPSELTIDPYAPEPNVVRVERIKDIQSGRDVFVRWLRDPSEPIPTIQTPNYDFHVDFNTDSQAERELPQEIQRLVLDDKPQFIPIHHEHKKSKKKSKYREHEVVEDRHKKKHSVKTPKHHHHHHRYHEVVYSSTPPLIQQQFPIPSLNMTFHTIELPFRPTSTPFWYFPIYLVGGYIYELNLEDMKKIPSLLLNNTTYMKQFYDPIRQVYCISRHRAFFEILVFYINHGILSRPIDLPLDLYIEELNYYFPDAKFLSKLKKTHELPHLSYATEIRYLPRSSIKKFLWRSMEYNETFFGPLYRFIFGLICLYSIFLFMYEIIVTRNENFLEFIEKYRGYIQNKIHPVNVTVHFIDYRPDTKRLAFSIEILFIFLWTMELFLRIFSAPNLYHCIKSIFFWIDIINILNTILYGIFSLIYNRQKNLLTNHIKSMTLIFQLIDIIKTLRMIKLGKYHRSIKLIIESLGEASFEFLTLCIVLLGTSCVFGTMIYSIERTTNPASTILYPNVGNGVYYAILAITNVGFEGFLPTTYLGKWIACAAITIGILTIALVLPLILSAYTRQLLIKNKHIIYRDEFGAEISNDHPDVKSIRRY